MKERPILFSGAMVRAILDGRKTQTRRVIKGAPAAHETGRWMWTACSTDRAQEGQFSYSHLDPEGQTLTARGRERTVFSAHCPYGAPGDRLWVRETWTTWDEEWSEPIHDEDTGECIGEHSGTLRFVGYAATPRKGMRAKFGGYDATPITFLHESSPLTENRHLQGPWRPSIHMPRWASRLTLEVVSVRVERLCDISEADARAEGVAPFFEVYKSMGQEQTISTGERAADAPHRASFACLWDEINGDRALWKSNPFVWRIEFRRLP